MKQKLKVVIPLRFKDTLARRFDFRRTKVEPCPLCEEFRSMEACSPECPFQKFGVSGCFPWMKSNNLFNLFKWISEYPYNKTELLEEKRKAKQLITFEKEKK